MAPLRLAAGHRPRAVPDIAALAATIGVVTVGAALVEAALIPGLLLGAAAVLAPKLASQRRPGLRRFRVGRSLAKTVTFRVTMATVAFTWDYIVLGELVTAAGLSALSLAAGPIFYFLHEAAWNYAASSDRQGGGSPALFLDILPRLPGEPSPVARLRGFVVDQTAAKTAVYEIVSSTAEFGVNFLVVGDWVTAAVITAPIVILGPFLYYGHEKLWDSLTPRTQPALP